jgi:hypothetical protein
MLPIVCQSCSTENEPSAQACYHCGCPHFKAAEPTGYDPFSKPLSYPLAWKVYSTLVILVNLATVVFGEFSISNILGGVISLALCMPLVGHAWQWALVPSWVGKVSFVLSLLCIPIVLISSTSRLGVLGFLIAAAILLLYAPFCRASFLYGYRSKHLWSATSA